MIQPATQQQIMDAYNHSAQSYIAKSTRRLLFNFSTSTIEERGHYYAEQVGGFGTGILIYRNFKYFLLTAKHNISNYLHVEEWRTESPIWVTAKQQPHITKETSPLDMLGSFFMARRMWDIGAITANDDPYIDSQDITLIEFSDNPVMYYAMRNLPETFVDLNDRDQILFEDEFFDKQIMVASGFPEVKNEYIFDPIPESDAIHVQHNLNHLIGIHEERGCLTFGRTSPISHEELKGMSGGPVFTISEYNEEIKLAGITLSGGNNTLRFLPSHMFIGAIENYKDSPCTVLDPASYMTDETTERPDEVLRLACSLEDDEEACLRRHRL